MTIGGALSELNNLLKADDIPFYYKPSIKKVIETITMEIKPMPQEQCEDCISREAVENAIKHAEVNFTVNSDIDFTKHKREVHEIVNGIVDAQIKALRDLPSVTAQPKMGKWEWNQYDGNTKIGNFHCSLCHSIGRSYFDYCPYCGAKIDHIPTDSEKEDAE